MEVQRLDGTWLLFRDGQLEYTGEVVPLFFFDDDSEAQLAAAVGCDLDDAGDTNTQPYDGTDEATADDSHPLEIPEEPAGHEADGPCGEHVLDGLIADGREFVREIPRHLAVLARELSLPALEYSWEFADRVGIAVEAAGAERCLSTAVFPGLVAYTGELIRLRARGQWTATYDREDQRWNPMIRDPEGRLYNPWLEVYKLILEGNGSAAVSIAAAIELSVVGGINT